MCSSTSSPRRAPVRAWSTRRCVPPTRGTSPVALVDVAQELIINEEDPFSTGGPVRGIWVIEVHPDGFSDLEANFVGTERTSPSDRAVKSYLDTRLFSRTLADDITLSDGRVVEKGTEVASS
jgi:hypothetical protein